jgi:hypothetical protein
MSEQAQTYKVVIKGEDGRGDQVFEAATPEELAQVFEKTQTHATRKIGEQEEEIRRLREENEALSAATEPEAHPKSTAKANGEEFDRERYLNLLASDPFAANRYLLAFEEAWPESVRKDYNMVRTAASYGLQQQINAAFVREHPELLQVSRDDDQHNSKVISKILTDNGWAYNKENLEAAFLSAKSKDMLRLPAAPKEEPPPAAVVPTVISEASGQTPNADAEFEKWVRTHPNLDEVRRAVEQRTRTRAAQ